MKAPRKLKCDVSNIFLYRFLEKKKQNKNKFESNYETKTQTAVAGTNHTITTDTNKIIHRKLISKSLPNSFHNLLSRRGENRRGPDGKFATQKSPPTEEDTEDELEETEKQDPSTPNTSIDTLEDSFDFAAPTQIGRGRAKTQDKKAKIPGEGNLKMHVGNMNVEQLQQAMETIDENPDNITIVDNNGNNENYNIKTEIIEPIHNNNNNNNNSNVQVRRSNRIKNTNPINRLGNPITF